MLTNLTFDILELILEKIPIKNKIKYVPFVDGEINYTIFYKEYYPYYLVSNDWNDYYSKLK